MVVTPLKFTNMPMILASSTLLASSIPHIIYSMTAKLLTFAATASGHHPDPMMTVSLAASQLNPTLATTFRSTTSFPVQTK